MSSELTDRDRELLTGPNFATFVTLDGDGMPHSTLIWVDAADGSVLVNTAKGRVKDRNVRRDPRVSLLVIREGDAYDWISLSGHGGGHRGGRPGRAAHRRARAPLRRARILVHTGPGPRILTDPPRAIVRYRD